MALPGVKGLRPNEENIKCCLISGVVAGSKGEAQSYEFSSMCAQLLLCQGEIYHLLKLFGSQLQKRNCSPQSPFLIVEEVYSMTSKELHHSGLQLPQPSKRCRDAVSSMVGFQARSYVCRM